MNFTKNEFDILSFKGKYTVENVENMFKNMIREASQYNVVDNNKVLNPKIAMSVVDKIRKLTIKYKLEDPKTMKMYINIQKNIRKNKGLTKDTLMLIDKYHETLSNNIKTKLENKSSLVTVGLGIGAAIVLLTALKDFIEATRYAFKVLMFYWSSRLLSLLYGSIMFPIHAFFSIVLNTIKMALTIKHESVSEILSRLKKKYFDTKNIIEKLTARALGEDVNKVKKILNNNKYE